MTRRPFQLLVAAGVFLTATSALSRPFFDPRAEKREALDADPVFSARGWDPACHAAQLVSTGGLAPRDPHTLAGRRGRHSQFQVAPCRQNNPPHGPFCLRRQPSTPRLS